MPTTRRCVFGCKTTGVTIHSFPQPTKDPERFKIWVNLAETLLSGLSDDEIYLRKKVCDIHFRPQDKNRNNHLNTLAVPSLLLPDISTIDIASHQICSDLPSTSDTTSHQIFSAMPSTSSTSYIDNDALPSTLTVMRPGISTIDIASHQIYSDLPSTSDTTSHQIFSAMPSTSSTSYIDNDALPSTLTVMRPGISTIDIASHQIYSDLPSTSDTTSHQIFSAMPSTSSTSYIDNDALPSTLTVMRPGTKPKPTPRRTVTFVTKTTQTQIKNLKRQILRLKKRGTYYKTRIENAEKLSNQKAFEIVTSKMKLPAKLFTNMQYRETRKKPKGRRFTLDEKILSLSLYKRSPKSYNLLSKCFTLPSARALKMLLAKIKLTPGLNKPILEKIEDSVANMSEDEKLCVLIFDEMYITPQIHYDAGSDQLKGFTTNKTNGKHVIADHALTFMVRGIKKNYKQPVAYYFTQNLNKIELKNILKNVIKEVFATGLKILATVCDQSTTNVGAIEELIKESKEEYLKRGKYWKEDVIIFEKEKIITLYDVPHLLKGLRNNLLTKNLIYYDIEEKKQKVLKWEYFEQLYEADKSYGELKIMQKITEGHIKKDKINKMKVKTAAQVFSHSVAIAAKHLSDAGRVSSEVRYIEPFVLIIDKLFDSLNCNTFNIRHGKIYRAAVKTRSPHHRLWIDAINFLKNIKFLEQKKMDDKIRLIEKTVPSLTNLIKTIQGMQAIWKILSKKHGFDTMLCRNFNQDPIENFFGNIRSLGARNVAPNCVSYEGAYKSLLLSNFSSSHSIKANCEEDMATYLQTVNFFLDRNEPLILKNDNVNDLPLAIPFSNNLLNNDNEMRDAGLEIRHYVSGWVLKKCLTRICKSCKTCRQELLSKECDDGATLTKNKEFESGKKWLVYPSKKICDYFYEIQKITTESLKNNISIQNTKYNIKVLNELLIDNFILNCKNHSTDFKKMFEDSVMNILIYSWCRTNNRILSGKVVYDGDDDIKSASQDYYNKHRHNKTKK